MALTWPWVNLEQLGLLAIQFGLYSLPSLSPHDSLIRTFDRENPCEVFSPNQLVIRQSGALQNI